MCACGYAKGVCEWLKHKVTWFSHSLLLGCATVMQRIGVILPATEIVGGVVGVVCFVLVQAWLLHAAGSLFWLVLVAGCDVWLVADCDLSALNLSATRQSHEFARV